MFRLRRSNAAHGIQGRFVSGKRQMVRNSIRSPRETETQVMWFLGRILAHAVHWQTNCTFLWGVEPKKGAISVMPIGFLMFAHRYNPDRTCDSICSRCFRTIATVRDQAELPKIESQHVCDPHILERFGRFESSKTQVGSSASTTGASNSP